MHQAVQAELEQEVHYVLNYLAENSQREVELYDEQVAQLEQAFNEGQLNPDQVGQAPPQKRRLSTQVPKLI